MEEAEWAVESCKATGKPTAVSLCIGPQGDLHGIPTGECAVRLAHAGIECSDSRIFCTKVIVNITASCVTVHKEPKVAVPLLSYS